MNTTKAVNKEQRGFTLMELMIVVAIVGILAMVAYPSYSGYVVKGNRAAAQAYLMDVSHRQQLLFNDSRTYATDETGLNLTEPEKVDDNYTVVYAMDPNSPPTFSVTATPKSGTRQVGDGALFIDNTGTKTRGGNPW